MFNTCLDTGVLTQLCCHMVTWHDSVWHAQHPREGQESHRTGLVMAGMLKVRA